MDREIFFVEKTCVGKGDSRSSIVGSPVGKHDAEMRGLTENCKDKNLDYELLRLQAELDQRTRDSAQQRDRAESFKPQSYLFQEAAKETYNFGKLVGVSPSFKKVVKEIESVASSDSTVLIYGETGTGKELIARAIHAQSSRRERPLIIINCATLPIGLIESELFGHERGAFTGALQRKTGRFELADGATIFLDEICTLPLEAQTKLLRVLQEGEFERVGGTQSRKVDARVLAAANQPLEHLVAEGRFRADLFYRINVFPIVLPPLRERREDVMALTNHFVQRFSTRFRKRISSISRLSLDRLQAYNWPGNVRELEHLIERAVLVAEGDVLIIDALLDGKEASPNYGGGAAPASNMVTLSEMERAYIERVLRHTRGVIAGKGGAAEILGLPASTLRSRIKKLGLNQNNHKQLPTA